MAQHLMEADPLPLEPVRPVRPTPERRPFEPDPGRNVEDQRQVGPVLPDRDLFEAGDEPGGQIARGALIGAGRIGEAVADHPGAAFERRQDRPVQMVDAGGRKQHRLGLRPERLGEAGQNDLAQRLGVRRAAGLARAHDLEAGPFEPRLEPQRLHGFAGPLAAFERDETAPASFDHARL